jgi:hypothetical protein
MNLIMKLAALLSRLGGFPTPIPPESPVSKSLLPSKEWTALMTTNYYQILNIPNNVSRYRFNVPGLVCPLKPELNVHSRAFFDMGAV